MRRRILFLSERGDRKLMLHAKEGENRMSSNDIKKQIVFILPGEDLYPIGGYKVVYEYANRFAESGYDTHIVYPAVLKMILPIKGVWRNIRHTGGDCIRLMKYIYRNIFGKHYGGSWFPLNSSVQKDYIRDLSALKKYQSNAVFFATSLPTSYALAKIKTSKNKYFYLIQGFEDWEVPAPFVYNSYKFGFQNIVIADWLLKEVEKTGQTAQLIYNGFDFDSFKMTAGIKNRKPATVAMLYHKAELKRCDDSLTALKLVKKQVPELTVTIFGTPDTPPDLPDWILYYQCPDKKTRNKIYNSAAIFVAASRCEGMALPPAEAMICGCALACTDIGGFSVYAKNNETALLSPVYDPEKLAANILKLITDNELRHKIAEAGNKYIRQFTWEKAFQKLEKIVNSSAGELE